ncbi:hypothetical protein HBO23_32055 [Pseudomonas sp. WS 5532]|uniref:hypothetical protein n=1 Tax=Pseudomonas sp. WS 5532 TaxID=2717495 RepID=UPI0014738ABF|nr:hypothetical protein [Pseudomonas sp. WS 5532]NMX77603.1 hypothetical protein [Pseudomonas sp. WS 5532]
MKVSQAERDASAEMADWLGFLRKAKRVTLQSIAEAHATQRSNLSAFITSRGTTRNISMEKVRGVLFDLGLLDGGMLAPGLHRWDVDSEMVDAFCELLVKSDVEKGFVLKLGSGYRVFMVVEVCETIVVFASLPGDVAEQLNDRLSQIVERLTEIDLDRAGDSRIQALWQTPDDQAVLGNLKALWAHGT